MGSPQSLSLLRPYTICRLQVGTPVYTRLCALRKSQCLAGRNTYSSKPGIAKPKLKLEDDFLESFEAPEGGVDANPATVSLMDDTGRPTNNNNHPGSRLGQAEQLAHFANLGAGVKGRIEQLRLADALKYPRMSPPPKGRGRAMRIPLFNKKFNPQTDLNPTNTLEEITLNGRVRSLRRSSSKLAFIDITQEFETVQIMLNWNSTLPSRIKGMDDEQHLVRFKEVLRLVKRGDIISITGVPRRTDTGHLCLSGTDIPSILSPSISILPEALSDVRMRNRHIDLLVNDLSRGTLLMRSHILNALRNEFTNHNFVEVSTPILASNASGAIANPFQTTLQNDSSGESLALRIAPELWLKRLVVGGFDRVFEIGPAFRNEGQDLSHNPEFTMCEVYQTYASLDDLMKWTQTTFFHIARSSPLNFAGHRVLPEQIPNRKVIKAFCIGAPNIDYPQVEYLPTLEEKLNIRFRDLDLALPGGRDRLVDALLARNSLGEAGLRSTKDVGKIFDNLAAKYLETMWPHRPFFITHQPAFMSPLSKWTICPKTKVPVAARAELFYDGMELANMYEEENSPFEQRRKFLARLDGAEDLSAWNWKEGQDVKPQQHFAPINLEKKRVAKEQAGKRPEGIENQAEFVDEQYVETLLTGMPPTGGWGCGIDRLVMLFSGNERISETLAFGSLRHVRALSQRSKHLSVGGR